MTTYTLTLDEQEAAGVATAIRQRVDRLENLAIECKLRGDSKGAWSYIEAVRRLRRVLVTLAPKPSDTIRGTGAPAFTGGK